MKKGESESVLEKRKEGRRKGARAFANKSNNNNTEAGAGAKVVGGRCEAKKKWVVMSLRLQRELW